jgi:hypothetical protein
MSSEQIMIFVVYDRAIDEEVIELLERLEIRYYTKWKDVSGVGRRDPHLGNDVWPGLNNTLMVVIEGERGKKFLEMVRALQKSFPSVGLRAFVAPVIETV